MIFLLTVNYKYACNCVHDSEYDYIFWIATEAHDNHDYDYSYAYNKTDCSYAHRYCPQNIIVTSL